MKETKPKTEMIQLIQRGRENMNEENDELEPEWSSTDSTFCLSLTPLHIYSNSLLVKFVSWSFKNWWRREGKGLVEWVMNENGESSWTIV